MDQYIVAQCACGLKPKTNTVFNGMKTNTNGIDALLKESRQFDWQQAGLEAFTPTIIHQLGNPHTVSLALANSATCHPDVDRHLRKIAGHDSFATNSGN